MAKDTEDLRRATGASRSLDIFDRKILAALTQDARQTYAEIGILAGLSAPAVYERVRRMKASGALKGTTAMLDAAAIGKPLLSFVHVDAEGWGKSVRMMRLATFPEVEEMHSVAGDTCLILKVRTASTHALEEFLAQVYVLPGVRGTNSFVVLSTLLERPVQAGITEAWPPVPYPP